MPFAARSDLLARSNARRLAQLAVPADVDMVSDELLRAAIAGDDLSDYTDAERSTIALALDAIDTALADADAVILSYGIPATVQTTLLARIASTIAFYNLQSAEQMPKEVSDAYDKVIAMLDAHRKGKQDLIPAEPTAPAPTDDAVIISSRRSRYGVGRYDGVDDCD